MDDISIGVVMVGDWFVIDLHEVKFIDCHHFTHRVGLLDKPAMTSIAGLIQHVLTLSVRSLMRVEQNA